jgi:hypothetical protein
MFKDALGNIHYDFWQGIKINGKTFDSLPLFNLCQEFGDAQVVEACMNIGCLPYVPDMQAIKEECKRIENLYV